MSDNHAKERSICRLIDYSATIVASIIVVVLHHSYNNQSCPEAANFVYYVLFGRSGSAFETGFELHSFFQIQI